jgi:hypothetical protein
MLAAMSATTTAPASDPAANRSLVVSVVAIAFVAFNVLFFALSARYADSHRAMTGGGDVDLGHLRLTFAAFSTITAGGMIGAAYLPRLVGHAAPIVLAALYLGGAIMALRGGAPLVVPAALIATTAIVPALTVLSLRGSRTAWAFLAALCGVFSVVGVFASPRIRAELGAGLWTTMIIPGLNLVAVWALASLHRAYERDATR